MNMENERQMVKERSQIPLTTLVGDFKGLGDRVLTYAMAVHDPARFSNHILVVSGWEEPYLAVESERLETDNEMKRRIAKEERNQAAHEKWVAQREKDERELYEKLKAKYSEW